MALTPSVTLINEYYDTRYTNIGLYGTFTYAVAGIPIKGVETSPQAQALGLPKQGEQVPGVTQSAIAWQVGVSQVVNSVTGEEFCFVKVDFKPVNWNISRYLGGTTYSTDPEPSSIPVISTHTASVGATFYVRDDRPFRRQVSMRVESVRGGVSSLNEVQRKRDENLGKWYLYSGVYYILANVIAQADRGNNITIDTYFKTTAGVRAYPAGFFNNGNSFALPALPNLYEYDVRLRSDGSYGEIRTLGVDTFYLRGDPLPWLPQ